MNERNVESEAKEKLSEAITSRIRSILDTKGATVRSLLEIEKIANAARHMLAVGQSPATVGTLRRTGSSYIMAASSSPNYYGDGEPALEDDEDGSMSSNQMTVGGSAIANPNAETFGATYMRERIAAAGVRDMSPREMVEALVVARNNGLGDLSNRLEKALQLAIEPAAAAQAPRRPDRSQQELAEQP